MLAIADWLEAHPVIVSLVLLPVGGAIFNFLCKRRTPEEYEALRQVSSKLAAITKTMAGLFPDPHQTWSGVREFVDSSRAKTPEQIRAKPDPKNPG